MHSLFCSRLFRPAPKTLRREFKILRCSSSFGISNSRLLQSNLNLESSRRGVIVYSSSELEVEALRSIDVLERVTFGSVNRVFSKEELETILKQYSETLVVLKCKAKYCRPCMAFVKKYMRLAEEFKNVLFLEIMGDETKETRRLMIDFGVKATPTFRYYLHEECVDTTVGIKLERIQKIIKTVKPKEPDNNS